mgnify:CR=1 FL=1
MKVFLTGVTGFVGSALLTRYVEDGADVSVLVRNDSQSLLASVKAVENDLVGLAETSFGYVQGDNFKSDEGPSAELRMTLQNIDVVVHAAARAHIMRDDVVDPLAEYRKINRDATIGLARLAADSGVKRFVFLSSIGVNGNKNIRPFTERDAVSPHDPYSISKYEAEQNLLKIATETGMEVVIVRPPLVYGQGAPGNFASLLKWVKKGIPLPLGAVHNKRSLVALENLVDFIALCTDLERSPKAANEVFLISDGEDVSTTGLLRKVAEACGVKSRLLPIPVGLMRLAAKALGKGAVADRLFGNLQVDSSKARDLLGWKPVVTMDEALERMFEGKSL